MILKLFYRFIYSGITILYNSTSIGIRTNYILYILLLMNYGSLMKKKAKNLIYYYCLYLYLDALLLSTN